ncbi:hypothetical protein DENSPDRAFT_875553 [Dentipellis sp. KUC8613]|nr:hypothetical protein DENSPDRAFT_875553 [Dentipellis sp. KUC8613]
MSDIARAPLPVFTYVILPDFLSCVVIAFGFPLWIRLLSFVAYMYGVYAGMHFTTGDPLQDYSIGSFLSGQIVMAIHFLVLLNLVDDVRHERDTFQKSAREMPFYRRVYWAACYTHFPRSVGWSNQVSSIPPRLRVSRSAFVRSRLQWILWFWLVLDVAQTYQHTHPLFHFSGDATRSVGSEGNIMRSINVIAYMATPYSILNLQYNVCSVVAVLVGYSDPADWPDLFGKWADAYTIRKFWGRSWHQLLRRNCSSAGRFVSTKFGFKSGTLGSSYTQLYVVFILSGIMHLGGDFMMYPSALDVSFTYFILQAIAITAEDAIVGLGKRVGIKESGVTHALGYISTFVWLSWSTTAYIDGALKAGTGRTEALPFSLSRTVIGLFEY